MTAAAVALPAPSHPLARFLARFDEVLYFPSIPWDHPWERQQTLVSAFAAAHADRPGHIFPPLGLVAHSPLSRRSWRRAAAAVRARLACPHAAAACEPIPPNLHAVAGPFVPGVGPWRRGATWAISPRFRALRRPAGRRLVFACYANDLVLSYAESADFVVLDLAERRQANPLLSPYAKRLERTLAGSADVLVADNRATLADYAPERAAAGTPGHYVPQGHTPSGAARTSGAGDGAPLAYLGNLHHALDLGWLTALAAAHPERTFRFCGEVLDPRAGAILKLPNVEFWGRIPRAEIPRFLDGVAWGLIPYKVDTWTAGVFPTKLLEYLDCGVPVLSTALAEVAQFAHLPFVRVVRDAAAPLPGASLHGLETFLAAHTWDARLHAYGELLLEAAP